RRGDARDGLTHGDPGYPSGHRAHLALARGAAYRHSRDRDPRGAARGPAGALARALDPRGALRGGGRRARRAHAGTAPASRRAQHAGAAHRPGHIRLRLGHPARGDPVLPRRRHPTRDAHLGLALLAGLRAGLVPASAGLLAALGVALVVAALVLLRGRERARAVLARTLGAAGGILVIAYVAVLTVDMGYYLYSGQRLDAVFMEYISDLLGQCRQAEVAGTQVGTQTAAELSEVGTWAVRAGGYAALLAA